jgi:hypothetical protein
MGYYHSQADLSIVAYPNLLKHGRSSSWKAFNKAGVDVTAFVTSDRAPSRCLRSTMLVRPAERRAVTTKVPIVKIDLAKLNTCTKYPAKRTPVRQLVRHGHGRHLRRVWSCSNGTALAGKLTVATEGSLYIKGDYNTVAKKGASVIADAVNLLFQRVGRHQDQVRPLQQCPPTATTYNVAMVTGNNQHGRRLLQRRPGESAALPRELDRRQLHHHGSFVNFWNSKFATRNGAWRACTRRPTASGATTTSSTRWRTCRRSRR